MDISGYKYSNSELSDSSDYLLPRLTKILSSIPTAKETNIIDLGCGNGSIASQLSEIGFRVTGIDPSNDAIKIANSAYVNLDIRQGSSEYLREIEVDSSIIYSLEVIEHVYNPREFLSHCHYFLPSKGWIILSTPYHSYLKNLALAITGKMDQHFTALWPDGHIKFWSIKTITSILEETGFEVVKIYLEGRIKLLAKSMVIVALRI